MRAQSAVMKSSVTTARMGANILVGALVAHHAHRFDRQQNRKSLRRASAFAQQAGSGQFFGQDGIGFTQAFGAFGGHFSQNADGQPQPGNG